MLPILFAAVIFFTSGDGKVLPLGIELCRRSDVSFNACFETNLFKGLKLLANGHKSLGVAPLEPFFVQTLDLGVTGSGAVRLNQRYDNASVSGTIRNLKLSKLEASFTPEKCFWRFDTDIAIVTLEANYVITGNLLVFRINSRGKCNNTLYDLNAKHDMKCEFFTKNNKEYLRFVDYKLKMTPKDVDFNFSSAVEGNEQLDREIRKTIKENGLSLYMDIKSSFEKGFALIYKGMSNNALSKIPVNELFLD